MILDRESVMEYWLTSLITAANKDEDKYETNVFIQRLYNFTPSTLAAQRSASHIVSERFSVVYLPFAARDLFCLVEDPPVPLAGTVSIAKGLVAPMGPF